MNNTEREKAKKEAESLLADYLERRKNYQFKNLEKQKKYTTMTKKPYSTPFSHAETKVLVEIISKYSHIVQNLKSDAVTINIKHNAWEKIANHFNACALGVHRSHPTLKNKWKLLKKCARKDALAAKRNSMMPESKATKPLLSEDIFKLVCRTMKSKPSDDQPINVMEDSCGIANDDDDVDDDDFGDFNDNEHDMENGNQSDSSNIVLETVIDGDNDHLDEESQTVTLSLLEPNGLYEADEATTLSNRPTTSNSSREEVFASQAKYYKVLIGKEVRNEQRRAKDHQLGVKKSELELKKMELEMKIMKEKHDNEERRKEERHQIEMERMRGNVLYVHEN
uniref:Regulatory protein zeste n=2 Tax=Cacopsylla melanoneura TaxID=428564 RepID=A0A8D9AC27_9HEMI